MSDRSEWGSCTFLLLVYAFYARQNTLTPAVVGLFSLAAYMGIALILMPHFGLLSLMIADSVKHIIHATISGFLLQRHIGGLMRITFPNSPPLPTRIVSPEGPA